MSKGVEPIPITSKGKCEKRNYFSEYEFYWGIRRVYFGWLEENSAQQIEEQFKVSDNSDSDY